MKTKKTSKKGNGVKSKINATIDAFDARHAKASKEAIALRIAAINLVRHVTDEEVNAYDTKGIRLNTKLQNAARKFAEAWPGPLAKEGTWAELFPEGRWIYYEGNNPKKFVTEMKKLFGLKLDPYEVKGGFHCPAKYIDEIYGNERWKLGS